MVDGVGGWGLDPTRDAVVQLGGIQNVIGVLKRLGTKYVRIARPAIKFLALLCAGST